MITATGDGILAQLVEHLTFNQVVGGSNPPCLILKPVKSRVSGPGKSKVTKNVTKVTRKIQKGKAVDLCARGIAPCFFNLTSIEYRYTI